MSTSASCRPAEDRGVVSSSGADPSQLRRTIVFDGPRKACSWQTDIDGGGDTFGTVVKSETTMPETAARRDAGGDGESGEPAERVRDECLLSQPAILGCVKAVVWGVFMGCPVSTAGQVYCFKGVDKG